MCSMEVYQELKDNILQFKFLARVGVHCTDVFTTGVDASGAVSCAALTATGTVAGALTPAVCVARTTLQPLLGRTVQFDSKTSVGPRICSPMAATASSPSVVRKAHSYLQRRGCLRDSELAGKEAVYLCDGVVAEQRGCDRGRVLVCG